MALADTEPPEHHEESIDPPTAPEGNGSAVRCDWCEFEWQYGGDFPRTTCPECGKHTQTGLGVRTSRGSETRIPGEVAEPGSRARAWAFQDGIAGMCGKPLQRTRQYW